MTLQYLLKVNFKIYLLKYSPVPCHAIVGEIYRVSNTPANESVIRYESILSKLLLYKSLDIIIGTDQNFDYMKIN